jgi:2,3-dihydroxybenzoate-AMP ligase
MTMLQFPKHRDEDAEKYTKEGGWAGIGLGDILDRTAASFPNREALVDDRTRLSFADLREKVDRLACGLISLGLEKGERVLLQLPNWAEFVISYFALQKVGGIPVLLISGYRELEVSHVARLTGARAWIVPDAYRKIDYISFMGKVKQENPELRYILSVRAGKEAAPFATSLERLMEQRFTASDREGLSLRRPRPTEVAHILPSGGTTGLPKGIPRTHNDYLCNVEYQQKGWGMEPKDVGLLFVPVGHNLALLNIVGAVLVGYKLVLLDSTKLEDVCSTVEKEQVTYTATVPSMVRRILESDRFRSYNLSSLKKISAGGEPSPPELIKEVFQKLKCTYIHEFGMSEGLLCRTRLDDDIETICRTVGKPCCPDDEIKIVDEKGNGVPPGRDGELATRGPGIFAGYLGSPEENKRNFTGDGFFKTGDQARIDGLGYLTITGRIKDIIIRGGENISPAQVEEILRAHPAVADAAVVGMPDRELGERVCAYIQTLSGKDLAPEEIKTFMEAKGASRLLIPERFEFVRSLPMTEAGKHDKKALRLDIKEKIGQTS